METDFIYLFYFFPQLIHTIAMRTEIGENTEKLPDEKSNTIKG